MEHFEGAAYLRLRGLPFGTTTAEVVEFMDDVVSEDAVLIGTGFDGRPSGEAWLQLLDQETADQMQKKKNRKKIGTRYIEVFASTHEDMATYATKGTVNRGQIKATQFPHGGAFLRLRGLPFTATPSDIIEFFTGYGVGDNNVQMGFEAGTGRPSGEAWVQCPDEATAQAAREGLDKQKIGARFIEIFPSNAMEAAGALNRPVQGMKGKGAAMEGDWNCPNCGDLQFARNSACRRCGTMKPPGAGLMGTMGAMMNMGGCKGGMMGGCKGGMGGCKGGMGGCKGGMGGYKGDQGGKGGGGGGMNSMKEMMGGMMQMMMQTMMSNKGGGGGKGGCGGGCGGEGTFGNFSGGGSNFSGGSRRYNPY